MTTAYEQRRLKNPEAKPHIAIIGAGISGLRCADVLLRHGLKVTILEARDRVGGRMYQKELPNGHLVDMGPNWIHGTENNPLLDLAKETDTDVGTWDDRSYVFNEAGNLIPLSEGEKYAGIMWGIVEDAFKHSNKLGSAIDVKESLADFFREKVAEIIPDSEDNFEEKRRTVIQISAMWGAFVGSPITRQSLRFFWLEESIEGENLFCAGTYRKILEKIAKPAVTGADIRFNTLVEKIYTKTSSEEAVKLQTSNGQTLEFDDVVVTSTLGWLKRHLKAFEPALPNRLENAIASIGYGCLEKVYISFPEAFWLTADKDEDKDEDKVRGFVVWSAPKYSTDTNPEKWNQEAVELASLSQASSHPTLLFYTYGEESEYLTSEVAKLRTQAEKDDFLYAFFKPYYSRLPFFSEESPSCQPSGCLATAWLQDELAGHGSYTNFQVGLEEGDKDIETMRLGVPDRGLWLAGEHTAPFVALGTATGAYWSGEAVAKRIAEAYGLLDNPTGEAQ